jgi:DNA-binding response OmpR family regulator
MSNEPQKRILLVDDDPDLAELLQMALPDYEVGIVGDAETAINTAPAFMPDLFVVDLVLPGMRGTSLATVLQDTPMFSDTPVFLLSGLIEPRTKDGEPVRVHGLTAFSKPFKVEVFQKHVHLHLTDPAAAHEVLQQLRLGRIAGE